jgi:hypothetical protein
MTIHDTFENELSKLIFNASSIVNMAINASTAPLTTLSVSLHTAAPVDSSTLGQSQSETSYGGYVRVAVNRTATGWTVTNNSVSPSTNVTFAACTSGTATITHAAIGVSTVTASTSKVLFSGTVTPNISVSAGVTPRLTTASTIVLC